MVRASMLAASLALAACHPAQSSSNVPYYPLGDAPPPAPSERCFRERFEVRGKPFEMRLRLALDPPAGTMTAQVSESGANGDASWVTVMSVDGARFTSVERGPEGEARGDGVLLGPPWEWTGWQGVTHRAEGFEEHANAEVTDDALTIATETRAADGSVASTGQHRYAEVACATVGFEPIETLYPKQKPPTP